MDRNQRTAELEKTLRNISHDLSLTHSALLPLRCVDVVLSKLREAPSFRLHAPSVQREMALQALLRDLVWLELSRQGRSSSEPPTTKAAVLASLRQDFNRPDETLWEWSCLYFRFLSAHPNYVAKDLADTISDLLKLKHPDRKVLRLTEAGLVKLAKAIEKKEAEANFLNPATAESPLPRWPGDQPALIGREHQLQTMAEVWKQVQAGTAQAVLLRGEAGIGKTRLIQDFITEQAKQGARWMVSSADETDGDVAYQTLRKAVLPLIEQFRFPQNLPDWVLAQLAPTLPELADLGMEIPRRADVEPEQARDLQQRAWTRLLSELTQESPLILFIDDAQWIDSASLKCLHTILLELRPRKLLLCSALRTERPALGGTPLDGVISGLVRGGSLQEIDLERLGESEIRALSKAELDAPDLADDIAESIFHHSDGIPLFALGVISLIRKLGKPLESNDSRRNLTTKSSINVEEALRTMPRDVRFANSILSRLLQLDAQVKDFIELAAVVGRAWDPDLVGRACEIGNDQVDQALTALKANALIHEQAREFIFTHQLCRDIVYQNLGHRKQVRLHGVVARALEAGAASDKTRYRPRYIQQLAEHYLKAEEWDQALRYASEAGREALGSDATVAHRFLFTAVELIDRQETLVEKSEQLACFAGLGDAARILGEWGEAEDIYRRALGLSHGDHRSEADLYRKLAIINERRTRFEEAKLNLLQAMNATNVAIDQDGFSKICLQFGMIYVRQRKLDTAQEWAKKALMVESAQAHNLMCIVHRESGRLAEALDSCIRSIELAGAAMDRINLAKAHTSESVIRFAIGQWSAAIASNQKAIELQVEVGDSYMAALTRCNLSDQLRHLGSEANLEEARQAASASLEAFERLDSAFGQALAHLNLGAAWLASQNTEAAREHLETARRLLIENEVDDQLAEVERRLAETALAQGLLTQALTGSVEACKRAAENGESSGLGSALRVLAMAQARIGEGHGMGLPMPSEFPTEPEETLLRSRTLLETHGPRYELGLTCLELARYQGSRGQALEAENNLHDAGTIFETLGAASGLDEVRSLQASLRPKARTHRRN